MWKVIGKVVGTFLRSSWMLPTAAAVGVMLFPGWARGMSYVEMNAGMDVPAWLSYTAAVEFFGLHTAGADGVGVGTWLR